MLYSYRSKKESHVRGRGKKELKSGIKFSSVCFDRFLN